MPIYRHFAVPFFASCDAFETFSDWTLWRIFPCYFSKALPYWRRQKMNPNIQKIDILCNVTNKKFARHFENHRCMTWRHTGSDQWTNVYPRDGPSLLREVKMAGFFFPKKIDRFNKRIKRDQWQTMLIKQAWSIKDIFTYIHCSSVLFLV